MGIFDNVAGDMAFILGEQGQTCTLAGEAQIPCSFSAAGGVELGMFAEQDTAQARILVAIADLPSAYADPQAAVDQLCTAPDGKEYRIVRQNADSFGGAVLFTLTDPTGNLRE